jgi:hypothetical protein
MSMNYTDITKLHNNLNYTTYSVEIYYVQTAVLFITP